MVLLFGTTMFVSALLLFWVQLIIAKMLLPRLGGTPAVWTTCMLFFQVLLLAGYSYVLVTTGWIEVRKQAVCTSACCFSHCFICRLPLELSLRFPNETIPLSGLAQDARWRVVAGGNGSRAWTDDFSNIVSVFRWY